MSRPAAEKELVSKSEANEDRAAWETPRLLRIEAGSAENAFPGRSDAAFTQS